jgi:hypothetical protein
LIPVFVNARIDERISSSVTSLCNLFTSWLEEGFIRMKAREHSLDSVNKKISESYEIYQILKTTLFINKNIKKRAPFKGRLDIKIIKHNFA